MHVLVHFGGGQRTIYRSWFCSSTVWVPGIELESSVSAASAFAPEPSCWLLSSVVRDGTVLEGVLNCPLLKTGHFTGKQMGAIRGC